MYLQSYLIACEDKECIKATDLKWQNQDLDSFLSLL